MKHPWDQPLGVWNIAESHPDAVAIAACPTGETLTFAELAGRSHQIVHAVRAAGIGRGDVVAMALPNDLDIVLWLLAANEGGFRSLALNPALSDAEIEGILRHSGARAVVAHADLAGRLTDVAAVQEAGLRLSVGGAVPGFEDAAAHLGAFPTTLPEDRILGGPVFYSSGTTGAPKGIWREIPPVDPTLAADAMKSFGHAFQFLPFDGVHLVTAGMHHGGCQGFYLGALNVGQALGIAGKFDAEGTLAAIQELGVTTAYMVPTQFVRLLRLPDDVRARYDVSSLKVIVHSAAPCPLEIKKQMLEWWGPVIWETYGGTEGAATIAKPHRWLEKPGTVGRAIRGMQVVILDDDGNELPAGEVGNVYLRPENGSGRFEYKDDPELTKSVHRGDAFTIGDMGYLDEDGYLFISDRAKDLIISGGVNIYPAEIEGVLTAHPAVGDVAVIGVPDPEWGEQIRAIVELAPGHEPSDALAEELQAHCREHLAGFKCPRALEFRTDLPRTDGGKLLKRQLRDEFWAASGRSI